MHLIRAATLTVSNLDRSASLYRDYLDYTCIEDGRLTAEHARAWGADSVAGLPYCVMQPSSGSDVFLRFIEQPKPPRYQPLKTYGWAAIEINNQDTLAVSERLKDSPFEIIGPPKELDGMPAIFPMQVKGPDGEIVYLTEIRDDLPEYDLPRAKSLIDQLFILVVACSDMEASGRWLEAQLLLEKGRSIELIYTMINGAFGLAPDTKHTIATLKHERDVFLEIDQYPNSAKARRSSPGYLPPCVAIGSFNHPDFDVVAELNSGAARPLNLPGAIYGGKRSIVLRGPDNTLFEIIEA